MGVASATPNRFLGMALANPPWLSWGGRTTPYFIIILFYIYFLNINNILLFYIK
jgi:hypothetical protein